MCQGERKTLSFGSALQLRLFHTLSADTQKMIRNYINVQKNRRHAQAALRHLCQLSVLSRSQSHLISTTEPGRIAMPLRAVGRRPR